MKWVCVQAVCLNMEILIKFVCEVPYTKYMEKMEKAKFNPKSGLITFYSASIISLNEDMRIRNLVRGRCRFSKGDAWNVW